MSEARVGEKPAADDELTDAHADHVEEAALAVLNHLRGAEQPFATVESVRDDLPEHVPEQAVEPALERLERDGLLASYVPGGSEDDRLWYGHSHIGGDDLERVREMNRHEREVKKQPTTGPRLNEDGHPEDDEWGKHAQEARGHVTYGHVTQEWEPVDFADACLEVNPSGDHEVRLDARAEGEVEGVPFGQGFMATYTPVQADALAGAILAAAEQARRGGAGRPVESDD